MPTTQRMPTMIAAVLIGLGILFLAVNVLGINFGRVWPLIFFVLGAGFYVPIVLLPEARGALAALIIPGTILIGLGLIFFYNTLTDDWDSWAYVWALIPAFVGLGLMLAARIGGWANSVVVTGFWIALGSGAVFGVMAMFFGSQAFGTIGPIVLIAIGVLFLIRSARA